MEGAGDEAVILPCPPDLLRHRTPRAGDRPQAAVAEEVLRRGAQDGGDADLRGGAHRDPSRPQFAGRREGSPRTEISVDLHAAERRLDHSQRREPAPGDGLTQGEEVLRVERVVEGQGEMQRIARTQPPAVGRGEPDGRHREGLEAERREEQDGNRWPARRPQRCGKVEQGEDG
jgi:hypothetical protein